MKNKNILITIVVFTLVITTSICGAFAYFTDKDTKTNILSVGDNNTKISETFESPETLYPGQEIEKKVSVLNEGSMDCYIRVAILVSNKNMDDKISLVLDTTNWVNGNDGFYYYTKSISENESTSNLLSKVIISSSASPDEIENFKITIYSESIQKGNYDNYSEAWNNF